MVLMIEKKGETKIFDLQQAECYDIHKS